MIDFNAFSDELVKIAQSANVSIVDRLPKDREKALDRISSKIDRSKMAVLGFPSVAVPSKLMGDIKDYGFKATRLAVPLPWEKPGTTSWRKGKLHAHKKDTYYVVHKDETPPSGAVASIKHWAKEGLPAMRKRFSGSAGALQLP